MYGSPGNIFLKNEFFLAQLKRFPTPPSKNNFFLFFQFSSSFNTFVTIFLILLPDIPLSCLEERKPEDVQLLKKKISQLKQGRSGDFQPKGNSKTPNTIRGLYIIVNMKIYVCMLTVQFVGLFLAAGVARWPLFQNNYSQPVQLVCFSEINMQGVILVIIWLLNVFSFIG